MIDSIIRLLHYPFVQKAILAGFILAIAGGILGPIILARRLSFAVHASSELALTGAAAALVGNFSVPLGAVGGCLIASIVVAWLAHGKPDSDAIIAVVLSFGLGIAVLLLHAYQGRQAQAMQLLTGQIVTINIAGFTTLAIVCGFSIVVALFFYKTIIFMTIEPELARTGGVNTKALAIMVNMLIALVTAEAMQVVGSLLVMSLLITPAAAARYVSSSMSSMIVCSIVFASLSAIGGIIISLGPGWPVSAPITAISFLAYLAARTISKIRTNT